MIGKPTYEELERLLEERTYELETKASKLKEINTALNVLLEKRKADKIELEEKILLNVESLIKPYLDKLQQASLDADGTRTQPG